MNKSNDPAGAESGRHGAKRLVCSAPARSARHRRSPRPALAQGDEEVLTEALVLRDPDIPVAGNPDGDVTIVEYFDYNCPYCRKVAPEIRQVVQDDGKVRLVLKDWPVLGEVSMLGVADGAGRQISGQIP